MFPSTPPPGGLQRSIGPWQAAAIVVGTIIGTGVFLKTATMAQLLGGFPRVIAAWIVAGLLSYAGALSYAELCARVPTSGGEYAILRESYGRLPAFLYGWTRFWVGAPGSIAAYAVGSATFLAGVVPLGALGHSGEKIIAVGLVVIFTAVNCLAVTLGAQLQTALTALKLLLIAFLVCGVALFAAPHGAGVLPLDVPAASAGSAASGGFGLALVSALWAYDGWNNLPMVGGEVRNPRRNIPLALGGGVLAVIALYVAINWAYFRALTVEQIQEANSSAHPSSLPVATLTAQTFLGPLGVPILSFAFVVSALGAMNGSILTGARVPFAMAEDGLFFDRLARVDRSGAPAAAVIAQGAWSSVLAVSGTFDELTDYVVVTSWLFYALTTSALFVLRRREPRPIRSSGVARSNRPVFAVPGYPLVPLVFIAAGVFLVANSTWHSPRKAFCGLLLLAAGVPVFLYFRKRSSRAWRRRARAEDAS
jgi:basic amino acid/polyamine antiporter, APA family